MSAKANLKINQGATFTKPFYWYDGAEVIVPITAIADGFPSGFPPLITAAGHGLPALEIPCRILGVKGPTTINTDADDENSRRYVQKVDVDTAKVMGVNISGAAAYKGNGFLVYTPPKNLSGYIARMQIRPSVASTTVLLELTSDDGDIVLTSAEGLVELTITAAVTAAFTFKSAVYDLELVLPGVLPADDVVERLAYGTVTVSNEVTRPTV